MLHTFKRTTFFYRSTRTMIILVNISRKIFTVLRYDYYTIHLAMVKISRSKAGPPPPAQGLTVSSKAKMKKCYTNKISS